MLRLPLTIITLILDVFILMFLYVGTALLFENLVKNYYNQFDDDDDEWLLLTTFLWK